MTHKNKKRKGPNNSIKVDKKHEICLAIPISHTPSPPIRWKSTRDSDDSAKPKTKTYTKMKEPK
ncbi:Myosin-binding protein C, slow-type [Sesbania bispinosa]|nr:Myosin-binding protein C, slow-type [Sesbania bispinosa]